MGTYETICGHGDVVCVCVCLIACAWNKWLQQHFIYLYARLSFFMILWTEPSRLLPRSHAYYRRRRCILLIARSVLIYSNTHKHKHTSASSLIKILLKIGWSSKCIYELIYIHLQIYMHILFCSLSRIHRVRQSTRSEWLFGFCYWSLLACAPRDNYTQKQIVNKWVHKNYFVRSKDFYIYCNIFAFICSAFFSCAPSDSCAHWFVCVYVCGGGAGSVEV